MADVRVIPAAALAMCVLGASACGGEDDQQLTVFAASSLTEAFTELGARYEDRHPGVDVRFNFFASSVLAHQIIAGAPADVFASAAGDEYELVEKEGLAEPGRVVARNRLALIVPAGNPAGIAGVADLEIKGAQFVTCAESVPCGRFAAALLDEFGVDSSPVSREDTVKAVVAKVVLGEADAGIVFATDVEPAGDRIEEVEIPADRNVTTEYVVGALEDAKPRSEASAFVEFLASGEGRTVLTEHGFSEP